MAWLLQRQLVGILNHRLPIHSSKYIGQQSLRLKQRASVPRGPEISRHGSECCIQRVKSQSLAVESCCKELLLRKRIDIGHRSFHTTQPCYGPLPFMEFASVLVSVVLGRKFRKWWKKLSAAEKAKIRNMVLNKKVLVTLGVAALAAVLYYFKHLEVDPITNRERFIMVTREELRHLSTDECDDIKSRQMNALLPNDHPFCSQVGRVMNQIMTANRETILKTGITAWTLYVINSPQVMNAQVLPDGSVFVYSGLMDACETDDQLGWVLCHEVAHVVLKHQEETLSTKFLSTGLSVVMSATIWATLPYYVAMLAQITSMILATVLFYLPQNRRMEYEADAVGLQLAAKACFDVRDGIFIIRKVGLLNKVEQNIEDREYLSTHPHYKKREAMLNHLIPDAIRLRERCKCKPLSGVDPRDSFERWLKEREKPKNVETVVKI